MTHPDYDGRCSACYHDRTHDAAAHASEVEAYIQAHRDLHEPAAGALCHEGPDGLCLLCQVEMSHCSLCQGVGYHRENCPALDGDSMTYNIDDEHGNRITAGLADHNARRVAQRVANERGKSVWLYADGTESDSVEVSPEQEVTDRDIISLRSEAAQHGDLRMAMICVLALGGPDALGGAEPGTEAALLLEAGHDQAWARQRCAAALLDARAQEV